MAARRATFGSKVAQTCARSEMVHSAMAFLASWCSGPSIPVCSRNKASLDRQRTIRWKSASSRSLILVFPQGFALVQNDLRVDKYSIPTRLYLPTYKIKGYSGKLDLPHPHMMVDAFGNGDDCRKAMSSPESGNIDYGFGPSPTYWHHFVRTASSLRYFN